MLEPANVLEIIGNRVNYAVNGEGIDLGSLELEPGFSVVPKGFDATHHQGCYGMTYCATHLVIFQIDEIDAKNCGTKQ